jgi:hypothetical protein
MCVCISLFSPQPLAVLGLYSFSLHAKIQIPLLLSLPGQDIQHECRSSMVPRLRAEQSACGQPSKEQTHKRIACGVKPSDSIFSIRSRADAPALAYFLTDDHVTHVGSVLSTTTTSQPRSHQKEQWVI